MKLLLTLAASAAVIVGAADAQTARNGNAVETVLVRGSFDPNQVELRRFGPYSVAPDGAVLFFGDRFDPANFSFETGLFEVRDGVARLLLDADDVVIDGQTSTSFFGGGNVGVRPDGEIVLLGDAPTASGGVFGAFSIDGPNAISSILTFETAFDPDPDDPPSVGDIVSFDTGRTIVTPTGFAFQGRQVTAVDADGFTLARRGFFQADETGSVEVIALEGGRVPGLDGFRFDSLDALSATDDGEAFFAASSFNRGTGEGFFGAVFVAGEGDEPNLILREGQDLGDGVVLSFTDRLVGGGTDAIVQGTVVREFDFDNVLLSVDAQGNTEILVSYNEVIDNLNIDVFSRGFGFEDVAAEGDLLAFTVGFIDDVTFDFEQALLGRTADGVVTELLRSGDSLMVEGTSETVIGLSLAANALAANGDLVFQASFDSGLSGLFRLNIFGDVAPVPLPAGFVLMLGGLAVGAGLRRRAA